MATVKIECTDSDLKREGFIKEVEYNKTLIIPNNERLETLTHEEAATLFHRLTQSTQTRCDIQIRLGNVGDGGYDVCEDQRPNPPCLVYSFGIRNDFSFDDDVARRYGCEVHSFDPGMERKSFRHSDKVFFYDTGIAGKDSDDANWRLRRLSSIKRELNHTNVSMIDFSRRIDILKIDTEGAEWDALIDMHQTGELGKIPQILLEFHLRTIPPVDKNEEFTKESYILEKCMLSSADNGKFARQASGMLKRRWPYYRSAPS
ncbi:hypothetical protein FSP39_006412 [Pinctada imbricata]|uniref:Methyltransferase domain-containing protein n=1 Tax=Pinctada imbricata TaxID=66713 RepID=A0AA89BQQ0_PINIB|nr:hypothetical protein FSP39_006412 [Pinctada imbricata]